MMNYIIRMMYGEPLERCTKCGKKLKEVPSAVDPKYIYRECPRWTNNWGLIFGYRDHTMQLVRWEND